MTKKNKEKLYVVYFIFQHVKCDIKAINQKDAIKLATSKMQRLNFKVDEKDVIAIWKKVK